MISASKTIFSLKKILGPKVIKILQSGLNHLCESWPWYLFMMLADIFSLIVIGLGLLLLYTNIRTNNFVRLNILWWSQTKDMVQIKTYIANKRFKHKTIFFLDFQYWIAKLQDTGNTVKILKRRLYFVSTEWVFFVR